MNKLGTSGLTNVGKTGSKHRRVVDQLIVVKVGAIHYWVPSKAVLASSQTGIAI